MRPAALNRRSLCLTGMATLMAGSLIRHASAAAPSFTGTASSGLDDGNDPARADFWQRAVLVAQDGGTLRLADLRRPLALINLWANWCPGCLAEFASMQRMAGLLGSGADIILVSHPTNWNADQAFARRHPLGFPLYTFGPATSQDDLDIAYSAEKPAAYSVPQSLVFRGPSRTLAWIDDGAEDWDAPLVVDRLRRMESAT